jgi:hypothetical protein
MDEHVSWKMMEEWVGEYSRAKACKSARAGSVIVEVDNGMIGIKHPKEGLLQILNPNDFKIGVLRRDARILVCDSDGGDHFIYVLNPGAEKIVLLELVLEKEAFGIYSQDYSLGFELSREFCASAFGKNLLVVDQKHGRYVFFSDKNERIGAPLELSGEVARCTVIDGETAAMCTKRVLFVMKKGKRVGIDIAGAFGREALRPEFGVGESEHHRWLAVKDGEKALIVSLTDKGMGYALLQGNELKGKGIL